MPDSSKYAKNPNGGLIEIGNVNRSDRYALGPYSCVGCGNTMVPALGEIRAHHFKHKGGRPLVCVDETYLHNLAKLTVHKTISEAFRTGQPYIITYSQPISCDHYQDEFGIECTDQSRAKPWDIGRLYDTVELEKGTSGFVADILLSSSHTDKQMLLEIAVSHPCDQEKIDSGLRIVEITINNEAEIETLRLGIEFAANNVQTYNIATPKPVPGRCQTPCKKQGSTFLVFKNGKAWYSNCSLSAISAQISDQSVIHFEIAKSNQNLNDDKLFRPLFDFIVRAKFEADVKVKSCLICRHSGDLKTKNDIMCLEKNQLVWMSSGATYCEKYNPCESAQEAERQFNKSL